MIMDDNNKKDIKVLAETFEQAFNEILPHRCLFQTIWTSWIIIQDLVWFLKRNCAAILPKNRSGKS